MGMICIHVPDSFYRMFRDRERSSYFLRESGLGRLYINALGLDKQTSAARQILEWKRVSKDDEKPVLNYRPPIILCR